jgi:hypothetical protein
MLYAAIDIHKHPFRRRCSIQRLVRWSRRASRPTGRVLSDGPRSGGAASRRLRSRPRLGGAGFGASSSRTASTCDWPIGCWPADYSAAGAARSPTGSTRVGFPVCSQRRCSRVLDCARGDPELPYARRRWHEARVRISRRRPPGSGAVGSLGAEHTDSLYPLRPVALSRRGRSRGPRAGDVPACLRQATYVSRAYASLVGVCEKLVGLC